MERPVRVGEEGVAAYAQEEPDRSGLNRRGLASKPTGVSAMSTSPAASGPLEWETVPVCTPSLISENSNVNTLSARASPSVSTLIR